MNLVDTLDAAQLHQFYDPDLELVTRLSRGAQFCFSLGERMKEAHQIGFGKQRRLTLQLLRLTHRRFQQLFVSGNFRHEQVAEVRQQIATEVSQIVTTHHDVVHGGDRFGGFVCRRCCR